MASNHVQKIQHIFSQIILKGKIYVPRSYFSVAAYYVVPASLTALFVLSYFDVTGGDVQEDLGSIALALVVIIMFSKPLSIIFRSVGILKTITSFRRQLGVATLYFALFHFLLYAMFTRGSNLQIFTDALLNNGPLQFGAIALLIIFILGITSNKIATRILKQNWKRLHRTAYLLLPLILIHVALIKGESEDIINGTLIITAYITTLLLARRFKKKRGVAVQEA